MDKLIVAKRLRNLREQKNVSREQAAKDLDITFKAITDYETETVDRIPRDYIKNKLAEYYDTTLDSIFFTYNDTQSYKDDK